MKNLKITKVKDNSPYGLYVWLLPDGNIFRDDDNNVLNIPSLKGDQEKIDIIAKAAASYGQPEGKAVFQFYPKSSEIMESIGNIISSHNLFAGNFVIDNPNNPKKRRVFLLLKKQKITIWIPRKY